MKVYKGTIITVDKSNSIAKYLVEDCGKIVYVGNTLLEQYQNAPLIDLGNGALMPTFADTHGHFSSYAVLATTVKLDKAKSNEEIIKILINAEKSLPKKKTLICFGASPKVVEGKLIEKSQIDEVIPRRAVVIICSDGHTAVLNEKALNKLPKSLSKVNGYNYQTGQLKHECFYKVVDNMLKLISISDGLQAFQAAFDDYSKAGFGSFAAQSGIGLPFDLDALLVKWIYKGQPKDNGIQMRLFLQSYNVKKAKRFKVKRLGGCFACALDGSFTSEDAALLEPYCNNDKNYGILYYTDDQLYEKILPIHKAGLQYQMHAIGDAAVLQAARTFKRILDQYPKADHRHGIIHANLIPDEAMEIIDNYHLQIMEQPGFLALVQANYEMLISRLGEKRAYLAEPYAEYVKRGITVSSGSDCPVTFPNGIEWLHWLVNNLNEQNRLSLDDAIRICTYNGYWCTFDENNRGSLEQGKLADMIILDKNPYEIPPQNLQDVKILSTIYAGKAWHPSNKNIIGTILKGMLSLKKKQL